MSAIIGLLSTAICIGGFLAIIVLVFFVSAPIIYAGAVHDEEVIKEKINNDLKIARTNKILADQEVLESRRAKLDSEVAILELRIEEKRRNLGLDQDFHPTNY